MSGRKAASQLLATRSVHLRIQPRPTNLSESRQIYRMLQSFGDISTYKSLRYEYHNPAANSALAIYHAAESAQKALDASPIRFALEKIIPEDNDAVDEAKTYAEPPKPDALSPVTPVEDGIDEMLRPSPLVHRPYLPKTEPTTAPVEKEPPMPFEDTRPRGKIHRKWFQVTVDRSRVVHQDYVERQPYWKQFVPMKSLAQEDLAKVVPHIGLSDVSKRPMHAHRTPLFVLKKMSKYVENYMPTLKTLYEEGDREKR
ncbi:hypothetical protein M011DRAFT_474040 [Sporormia fimetaria CBS 119925]|uniref:Uncharacterized protein n=1 Tax=Sporormia fimetaria CBS 119925 TaxID=1340428 RepID=A0A6A6VPQ3_9PLEO|nr:hypothetical protein M011DRAFT_474040 [Sporormia fimetaria CBS 119925]